MAKSLAIGNMADGYYVLSGIWESDGGSRAATDEEIEESIRLLARTEGIFAEPAGAVTTAVARKLLEYEVVDRD